MVKGSSWCLGIMHCVTDGNRRRLGIRRMAVMIRQFSLPRSPVPSRPFPPNARRHQDGRSANWSGTRAAILRGDNASLSVLLIEKVGVGPGADQMQLVSLDAVNQQTLGLDMKLPVTFPDPPQRTIAIAHGQRFLSDQCRQRRPQPGSGPCPAFALSSRRA